MARDEIAEKLRRLLTDSKPWSEASVVYFLVEVRKLLDHRRAAGESDLAHLRFYCDWIVHISKDRTDNSTVTVISALQAGLEAHMTDPGTVPQHDGITFPYFDVLRREVCEFLPQQGVSADRFRKGMDWSNFSAAVVKVLEGQPLLIDPKHSLNITRIMFMPSPQGSFRLLIDFKEPVTNANDGTSRSFVFGGAY